MIAKRVFHPFLLVIFILLFLYKENIDQLSFLALLPALLASLAVVMFVQFTMSWYLRDAHKGGFITTLFVLFFFNYGRMMDARDSPPHVASWIWQGAIVFLALAMLVGIVYWGWKKVSLRTSATLKSRSQPLRIVLMAGILLVLSAVAIIFRQHFQVFFPKFFAALHPLKLLYFITDHPAAFVIVIFLGLGLFAKLLPRRASRTSSFTEWTHYLNFFSALILVMVLVQVGTRIAGGNASDDEITPFPETLDLELLPSNESKLPDIYYIVLDGYTGQRTLQREYGFDNSLFIQELEQRGFYVASESRSNYLLTFLSFTSFLNLNYLDFARSNPGEPSKDRTLLYRLIDYNLAAKLLKEAGYTFVQFSSGWGATEDNPFADIMIDPFKLNEFSFLFLRSTPLRLLAPNERATVILHTFEELKHLPDLPKPMFVLVHIESPHPPYLFDRDGNIISNDVYDPDGSQWHQKEPYLEQVQFVNKKTLLVIDAILNRSTPASVPIIIIQGDHGVETVAGWTNSPTESRLDERSDILNAYLLPRGGNELLYPAITPVNTFRLIFRHYFNQDFPLLEDKTYFSDYYNTPYKFELVYHKGAYVGTFPISGASFPVKSSPISPNPNIERLFQNAFTQAMTEASHGS